MVGGAAGHPEERVCWRRHGPAQALMGPELACPLQAWNGNLQLELCRARCLQVGRTGGRRAPALAPTPHTSAKWKAESL